MLKCTLNNLCGFVIVNLKIIKKRFTNVFFFNLCNYTHTKIFFGQYCADWELLIASITLNFSRTTRQRIKSTQIKMFAWMTKL